MRNFFSFLFLLCSFAASVYAQSPNYRDVVYLKNGSVIKGYYKDFYTDDSLRLETIDGGVLVCAFSDIKRIAKERIDLYVIRESKASDAFDASSYRHHGYEGFVDYTLAFNADIANLRSSVLSTTHGYRFNRHLFLGAGVSYSTSSYTENHLTINYNLSALVFHGDLQVNILKRRISPFIEGRAGYSVLGNKGLYIAPSAGVDFCITPRFGFVVSLGYCYFHAKDVEVTENDVTTRQDKPFNDIYLRVGFHF